MKFTKNRLLSLLLVLAMMLALVPSVFAVTHDDTHTLVWQLKDGKHVQVCTTPGCDYTPAAEHDPSWATTYTTGENGKHYKACTVSGCTLHDKEHDPVGTWQEGTNTNAGKHVRECSTCHTVDVHDPAPTGNWLNDKDNHWKACSKCTLPASKAAHTWDTAKESLICSTCQYTKIASVSVSLDKNTVTAASTMPTATATATVTAKDGTLTPDQQKVTWSSSDTAVATINENGVITAVKPGKTNIVATAKDGTTKSTAVTFTVNPAAPTVTAPTNRTFTAQTVKQGVAPTQYSVTATAPGAGLELSYKWYIDNNPQTPASGSTFTPTTSTMTPGNHTIKCSVTIKTSGSDSVESTAVDVTGTLTIVAPYRVVINPSSYNPSSPKVGDTLYYTIKAEKYTNALGTSGNSGYQDIDPTDNISLSISATSTNGSVSGNTVSSIYGNYAVKLMGAAETGSTSFTVTATANSGTGVSATKVAENSLPGSFTYQTISSPVLMVPYNSSVAYMDMNTLSTAVYSATSGYTPSSIYFYAGSYGTFNGTSSSSATAYTNSSTTYFTAGSSYTGFTNPNMSISFTAYDSAYSSKKVLAKGTIKFSAASSIVYNTTANTPVTFSYSDFLDFYQKSTYKNATLSTISITGQPTVASGSGTVGTLYYNGYSYNSTSYTRSYFTSISASNIGYISYTPSSSLTKYTVSIPFSLTGSSYAVSGTVTIKVNDGHVITMVGTDFKSASIWDDVRSSYPSVDYVRFSQPQSTVGKLYYGYTSIANKGSYVSSTDSFKNQNLIYSQASTYKSIDGVYFVPAADCLNTVTLSYTAYNGNTALGYGTITFTITKKTASSIFNDVTASNTGKWSADAIDFLARNSIVEGGSYGTFNPNGNMTRGDFVLMLYRMAGKPSVSGISNPFTDVKSSDYYYNAILWAYRNDIVTGVDAKTFAPKKNITREQIAATLYRMAGSPSTSGYLTGYYDYAKIHSYATNAMRWAISNGVITGSNGYLTPTNNATRAQVATMLHRYLTK